MHQRHRMDLDVVADDELHAREADAVGRQPPPAERRRRIGEVEHHLRAGRRQRLRGRASSTSKSARAFVDEALVALGAGDRHLLLVVQHVRRVAGADDRRQAELAADDRRMRGAAAMVGDDRRGALHDRHPVRVGRLR